MNRKTMKHYLKAFGKFPLLAFSFSTLFCVYVSARAYACTIFVLTDADRTLFCNNEDWSNPKTRVWFVPADDKHYGCMYVGFDDGWAQGGLNTKGLAFDWVAGYQEAWEPDTSLPNVRGNSSLSMLETCATVEEAIAFYRGHREMGFVRAKILVADPTGASVIIGAKDGKLQVEQENQCRGFGYSARTLDKMLAKTTEPTVANGARILRAALQKGQYATKYSNVFDLKSGDIVLFPFPDQEDEVKLSLSAELAKGGHYYEMPQIRDQLTQAPRPLLTNMERFVPGKYQPIPDKETQVTTHVRAMLQNMLDGRMRADDYTAELWKVESLKQKENQQAGKSFGRLIALTLVDRSEEGGKRTYRYRVEFEKGTLLQRLVFDEQDKLVAGSTEDIK